jgi:hypothetical protein
MLQAAPQFSPHQLIDAGRRAEAEGQLDYAAQFYRHLADHYPYTAEAAEARNALGRIGAAQTQVWNMNGAAHANGALQAVDPAPRAAPPRAPRRRAVVHRDHYRIGRALAALFSAIGWVAVGLGFAAPVLAVVSGGLPRLGLLQMAGGAFATVLVGFFVVLLGQSARALFDQANATRELVALERAKTGQH